MLFKGRLRLPNDPGEGIPIDLELEDVFLSLESEGEDFGEWRLDTVEINRLFSNQFAMHLDGEEMVFIADDALGFAYDGLSAIEDVKSRLSKRRVFKGRKPKKKTLAGRSEPEPEPDEYEPEETPTPEVTPDVPMPEVVPFFPEPSPSFSDSVAESSVVDQSIAPTAPKPIEIDDAAPQPVEMPPPAPEPDVLSPPQVTPEPTPVTEQPAASVTREVEAPAPPAADTFEDDDEEELVIEDVSAYGYVPVASVSVERQPVVAEPEPSDDDDIEIEEAAPATGAVLKEIHPLGEPEAPAAAEVRLLGEPSAPDRPAAAEPVTDASPPEPKPAPAAEAGPSVGEPGRVPLPPDQTPNFFEQWSSNGQAASKPELEPEPAAAVPEEPQDRTGPQTQKSGRHARSSGKSRSSLLGRKKSREPEAHEHRYESSKTVGGITRRVCAICGHVSFAGEDVYQDW